MEQMQHLFFHDGGQEDDLLVNFLENQKLADHILTSYNFDTIQQFCQKLYRVPLENLLAYFLFLNRLIFVHRNQNIH